MRQRLALILTSVSAAELAHLGRCDGAQQQIADCRNDACDKEACRDCKWGKWNEWSSCSCEGLKERHRTIGTPNTACGTPCNGTRVETSACNPDCVKPPRDCELEDWDTATWTDCTKTCGGGQKTRSRRIKTQPEHGGKVCNGQLSETKPCNTQSCGKPVDCALSSWSEWKKCSATCGGGQHSRLRKIVTHPKDGGLQCKAALSEVQPCNEKSCGDTKDCLWGQWELWSACSHSCGGGERSRSRMIDVAPRDGGRLCDPLVANELGSCNSQPCEEKKDCNFTPWSDWDGCSCTCKGIQSRMRHIKQFSMAGGDICDGHLKELQPCNVENCEVEDKTMPKKHTPIDCELAPWGEWQECSLTCGNGVQHRTRSITKKPQHGGELCEGALHEVRKCVDNEKCEESTSTTTTTEATTPPADSGPKVDCTWSTWEDWSSCSVSCGGGEAYRQRQVMTMPSAQGEPCVQEPSTEAKACNEHNCDCIDCAWAPWSEWGACACTGLVERHRVIELHAAGCGKPCAGPKVESKRCKPECEKGVRDCEFSDWIAWGQCTQPCGGGQRERTRSITHEARTGGKPCQGVVHEIEPCNLDTCHQPIDCVMGPWNDWSSCTAKCEGGEQYRHRRVTSESAYGGKPCSGDMVVVRACNTDIQCGSSVDCAWGGWAEWSACSLSCGGGYRTRDRHIESAPRNEGKLCEALSKMAVEPCNTQSCLGPVVDAMWDNWSVWTECSVSCGEGFVMRSRVVKIKGSAFSKRLDGSYQEYKPCTMESCISLAVDCEFSEWSAFGSCSCSCNGIRDRARRILRFPQVGGKTCGGPIVEVEPCNVDKCSKAELSKDCEFSDWGDWGACSAKCGGGSYTRERTVLADASGSGKACAGPLRMIAPCNTKLCDKATDCKWGKWSEWSDCSRECGGGERNRYRHILMMCKGGGKPCEASDTAQTQPCNEHQCGELQYCVWGPWNEWDQCSTTCGAGEKSRNRLLMVTTTKQDDSDVLASGILHEVFAFNGEAMSSAQLVSIFSMGMLCAALAWVAISARGSQQIDEPLLLMEGAE